MFQFTSNGQFISVNTKSWMHFSTGLNRNITHFLYLLKKENTVCITIHNRYLQNVIYQHAGTIFLTLTFRLSDKFYKRSICTSNLGATTTTSLLRPCGAVLYGVSFELLILSYDVYKLFFLNLRGSDKPWKI